MGIISKLKAVIGVADGERGRGSGAGTSVGVEREPAATGERSVKGVDPAPAPTSDDETPVDEGGSSATGGEPVDSIKGIGTAYADRLSDAGVHSITDLAGADAEALAAETGLGPGRIENWIEQAKARSR